MQQSETVTTLATAGLAWTVGRACELPDAAAHAALRDVYRDRVARLDDPAAREALAHALRLAHLRALERLVSEYFDQRHAYVFMLHNDVQPFRDAALAHCREALVELRDRSATPDLALPVATAPDATAPDAAAPLVDDPGAELGTAVEQAVLAELTAAIAPVPVASEFVTSFRRGAPASAPFLHLFAAGVAGRLATDAGLRAFVVDALPTLPEARGVQRRIEVRFGSLFAAMTGLADGPTRVEPPPRARDTELRSFPPLSEQSAAVARLAAVTAAVRGVPAATIRMVIARLDELSRVGDDTPMIVAQKAEEIRALRERLASRALDGDAVALERLEVGDLDGVRRAIAEARRRLPVDASREVAARLADEARLDRIELRYRAAADRYAEAAALVTTDVAAHVGYLAESADALLAEGLETRRVESLAAAVARRREVLAVVPRTDAPFEWAAAQCGLATALRALGGRGERAEAVARLEEAIAAWRAALGEYTREREPLRWASVQHEIGASLTGLGHLEESADRLRAGAEAYRAALAVRTRQRTPHDWAMSQAGLGAALAELAQRAPDVEQEASRLTEVMLALAESPEAMRTLREAREAYASALAVFEVTSPYFVEDLRGMIHQLDDVLELKARWEDRP